MITLISADNKETSLIVDLVRKDTLITFNPVLQTMAKIEGVQLQIIELTRDARWNPSVYNDNVKGTAKADLSIKQLDKVVTTDMVPGSTTPPGGIKCVQVFLGWGAT